MYNEPTTDDVKDEVHQYLWLVVIVVFMGFVYAFGIGANDVANSYATSVASQSLTLKQTMILASIFEFLGALLLGASVTQTVRGKIFDPNLYADEPQILVLGLTTSIVTASAVVLVATRFAVPISTTHTLIGCYMGFSITAKGFDSIDWTIAKQIFLSWLFSPALAGVIGFIFFGTIRVLVLNTENALLRAYYTFPLVLYLGIGIDVFFIIYKGFNNFQWSKELPTSTALPLSFGSGAFCGLLWLFPFGPLVMKRIVAKRAEWEFEVAKAAEEKEAEKEESKYETGVESTQTDETPEKKTLFQTFADATYNQDLKKQSLIESKKAKELWDNFELFNQDAEQLFSYVQVFTACLNSFAHGANDVANAAAPISGILLIYKEGEISSKAPVQKWILAYGGVGIVMGCILYGYKVMKTLGYKMTALSPSRGACAQLASSLFVVTASFLRIPVSTTQSITGAITGVGLASGFDQVNWLFFVSICAGWVTNFFVSVILSAGFFAFLAFSPSLT